MNPSLEKFLSDGPRFLRYDGGTVQLQMADASDPIEEGATLLKSAATGNFFALKITETPESGSGDDITTMG